MVSEDFLTSSIQDFQTVIHASLHLPNFSAALLPTVHDVTPQFGVRKFPGLPIDPRPIDLANDIHKAASEMLKLVNTMRHVKVIPATTLGRLKYVASSLRMLDDQTVIYCCKLVKSLVHRWDELLNPDISKRGYPIRVACPECGKKKLMVYPQRNQMECKKCGSIWG